MDQNIEHGSKTLNLAIHDLILLSDTKMTLYTSRQYDQDNTAVKALARAVICKQKERESIQEIELNVRSCKLTRAQTFHRGNDQGINWVFAQEV